MWTRTIQHKQPQISAIPTAKTIHTSYKAHLSLEVDEAVALGDVSDGVLHDLAGENVAESAKGVVQRLVVNGPVQVLDEHVAHVGAAHGRVALRPHDTARLVLDRGVVHSVQSALGCNVPLSSVRILIYSTRKRLRTRSAC